MKYVKYHTGYITRSGEIIKKFAYKGRNFQIKFEKNENCKSSGKNSREVIIYTNKDKNALSITKLIFSSISLLQAGNFISEEPPKPVKFNDDLNKEIPLFEIRNRYTLSCSRIPEACAIACRASYKIVYKYSLLKYYLACKLHCNEFIDLDPHGSEYLKLCDYSIDDHIRIGYAIVIFYSILEELGLDIHASNKRPSIINGHWNPEVKTDLEKRLSKYKINIKEPILWNLRYTPTNIEKGKKPIESYKAEWSTYSIRDSHIEIVDAIRIISWIRSKIVSHKLNKIINSISIYDVANANLLCRQILIDILLNKVKYKKPGSLLA